MEADRWLMEVMVLVLREIIASSFLPTGASRDPFGPNAARCCAIRHSTGGCARSGCELTSSTASRELGRSIAQTCAPFMS